MTRLEAAFDRALGWIGRHWLAIWIAALTLYVALPWVAPLLSAAGRDDLAAWIYLVYRPTCHQMPHHSWFLFGPRAAYGWAEVHPFLGGLPYDQPLRSLHHPLRIEALGYQVAVCQRDVAIYVAMWLGSVAFAGLRAAGRRPRLPFRLYLLALIPIAVDGLTQMVGWRQSTPGLRTLTGGLFGLATAFFVLGHLDAAFREAEETRAALRAASAGRAADEDTEGAGA